MEEKWLTVKETAEAIGKSEQTINIWLKDNKFPKAIKMGGSWQIPQSDIDALRGIKPEPSDKQEVIKQLSDDIELERKRQELDALKLHYPSVELYRNAQDKLVQELADVVKQKAEFEAREIQLQADRVSLETETKSVNAEIDQAHEGLNKLKTESKERIDKALKDFDSGVRGLVEKAAFLLTTPLTKAAGYVKFYRCGDCLEDGTLDRSLTFPLEIECGVCADCGQKADRLMPTTVCELCPVADRLKESARLILQALIASGIEPKFDLDGIYQPTIEGDGARELKPTERVRLIMRDYGLEI